MTTTTRKLGLALLACLLLPGLALAQQQLVNVGTVPGDHTGDPFRTAAIKWNANDTQLYGAWGTCGTLKTTGTASAADVLCPFGTANAPNLFLASPSSGIGALLLRAIVAGDLPASITSSTSGNAATATAFAANPTDCGANQYATTIAANGNLTCAQVAAAQVSGLAASATTDTTNAGNIGSGTLSANRLPTTLNGGLTISAPGSGNALSVTDSGAAPAIKTTCANNNNTEYGLLAVNSSAASVFGIRCDNLLIAGQLSDGSLTVASHVVTSSSDRRLKRNIRRYSGGLAEVLELSPAVYQWNRRYIDSDTRYVGFIANDVQRVEPLAVGVGSGSRCVPGTDTSGCLSLQDRALLAMVVNGEQQLVYLVAAVIVVLLAWNLWLTLRRPKYADRGHK